VALAPFLGQTGRLFVLALIGQTLEYQKMKLVKNELDNFADLSENAHASSEAKRADSLVGSQSRHLIGNTSIRRAFVRRQFERRAPSGARFREVTAASRDAILSAGQVRERIMK
jgi:hypothetical protein